MLFIVRLPLWARRDGAALMFNVWTHAPPWKQIYGALKRSAKKAKGGAKLGTIEAAVLGSGASLAAQAVTTPLDVVRTRVMTASAGAEDYEGDSPPAACWW